ncbi:MBL fold metallo-hydrolase [Methylacidimicrobium sp. B4]|uniref:MBL fold metallo-hydrolase n=1 Tax=Methylacidimicrobium sp. B4 TaxID=2796139 RepID=UPI001A8D3257|nr:MBL fold metallo-hydrolase [Methylacidimicrobium sp. B4]QSR84652.1 MBL fold metallo-hydrolase [Methylacidimicrobium sp. B4]
MVPLEDGVEDVIGKAARGLGLADEPLARAAGVSLEEVRRVKRGELDERLIRRLASVLHLRGDALVALGKGDYRPRDPGPIPGFLAFHTAWSGMTVNAYLVWDLRTREAAAFDTGGDCDEMLGAIRDRGLQLRAIFLTHTHGDHIAALDRLKGETGARAYVGDQEPLPGAEPFAAGAEFSIGSLPIRTLLTNGHSPGGITYLVSGGPRLLAIVGDSLFAGSMGGGNVSYADALRNNREKVLALPADTVICPGHGPLTSVAEEREHNPFFTS